MEEGESREAAAARLAESAVELGISTGFSVHAISAVDARADAIAEANVMLSGDDRLIFLGFGK